MKEKTILEYSIKIRRVREIKKTDEGYENTDKFFLVDIKNGYGGGIGFAVKPTGNYGRDLRKVFREILESLHL